MHWETAPIVYPSDTLAIAPESKVFETPGYWLEWKMVLLDLILKFVDQRLVSSAFKSYKIIRLDFFM